MTRSTFKTIIAVFTAAFVLAIGSASAQTVTSTYQYRSSVQKYADAASLRAETYAPKPADLVQIESINAALVWNQTSTAADDGANVIKQTNIATGRWINSAYSQIFSVAGVAIPALANQSCATLQVAVAGVIDGRNVLVQKAVGSTITAGVTLLETINTMNNAVELQACNNTGTATATFNIGLMVFQK